jgi:hypothetical protein
VTLTGGILPTLGTGSGVMTAPPRNATTLTLIALGLAALGNVCRCRNRVSRTRHWGATQTEAIPSGLRTGVCSTREDGVAPSDCYYVVTRIFIGGVFWLVYLAADSLNTTQRPAIVTTVLPISSPASFATLEATVTASGMSTDKRYLVQVDLITDQKRLQIGRRWRQRR